MPTRKARKAPRARRPRTRQHQRPSPLAGTKKLENVLHSAPAKDDEADDVPSSPDVVAAGFQTKSRVEPLPMTTQQIRMSMAEIRALVAKKRVPLLSFPLTTVEMSVVDFAYAVTLQNHKKRTVT